MEISELRSLIQKRYDEISELSKALRIQEMRSKGFDEVQEESIEKLLEKGDVYELEGSQSNFILLRNNTVMEVSVTTENDWTQILIRPYRYDSHYGAFVRKLSDSHAGLVKFISSLTKSEFGE